ncbi:MAG: PD-(D/E)XK nuclease family protein [Bacteroidota bacterium]|nr:PD-(D/E)XK nuclease family protein [Bacteroidota bacterium]
MSDRRILPPGADLIEEVARIIVDSGSELPRTTVIFPNKRPAHFLRKKLGERFGSAYMPPRIHTHESLIEAWYTERLGRSEPEIDAYEAVAIIVSLWEKLDLKRISSHELSKTDLDSALQVFHLLEQILAAGASIERLREAASLDAWGSARELAELYEPFYKEVERRGFSTRALRSVRVAQAAQAWEYGPEERFVVAGFFSIDQAAASLLRTLIAHEGSSCLLLNGPYIEDICEKLGVDRGEPADPASTCENVAFTAAPTIHDQVFAAAGLLRTWREEGAPPDERTLVLLPGPDLLQPVTRFLLPVLEGLPHNISIGYPLSRTPLFTFLLRILDTVEAAVDGFFTPSDYLRFSLHPYIKNVEISGGRSDVTRILFQVIERDFFVKNRLLRFRLEELEGNSSVFEKALALLPHGPGEFTEESLRIHLKGIHAHTLGRFQNMVDLGDFAAAMIDLLLWLADHSPVGRNRRFREYLEKFVSEFNRLKDSALGKVSLNGIPEYRQWFRGMFLPQVHTFPGTPLEGLQILSHSETRCLHFDRVIILDASDDLLPGVPPGSLLPDIVRGKIGLPLKRHENRETTYTLFQLRAGAREIHYFFSDVKGRERSRYVEEDLWRQQLGNGTTNEERFIRHVTPSMNLVDRLPGPIEKTPDMVGTIERMCFSSTALDTYLACPRRFYFRYLLRLSETESPAEGIDSATLGMIIHAVLHEYHRAHARVQRPLRKADLNTERIRALVTKHFDAMTKHRVGGVVFMHMHAQQRMEDYVVKYLAPLVEEHDIVILGTERTVKTEWNGYLFQAVIDRIERRDGTIRVIDYKTGGSKNDERNRFPQIDPDSPASWREGVTSFQLPLYAILLSRVSGMEAASIQPAILRLNERELSPKCEEPLYRHGENPADVLTVVERTITAMIKEMCDPAIPFLPPQDIGHEPDKVCRSCPYKTLCGTTWIV